jgi:hypothetical protein
VAQTTAGATSVGDQPEDIVAIEEAPDGGEGVAVAEVDAAPRPVVLDVEGAVEHEIGHLADAAVEVAIDETVAGLEGAQVLLAEMGLVFFEALLFEPVGGDAGALGGGDLDLEPVAVAGPGLVEEAAAAVGRGHADEPAAGDGEHGADRFVEVVADAGGLIEDQQVDARESADGVGAGGEADDPAVVFGA